MQRELQSHPDRTKVHENLFVGIAKCADCGKSMNLNCVTNQRKIVLESINSLISKVKPDEEKIMRRLRKLKDQGTVADDNSSKKVAKKGKRLSEIDRIYTKLYEDRALEIVSEENFRMLSDKLQDEQKKLRDELPAIKKRSEEFEKTEENIQSFVALIKSMKHVDELDRPIV